MLLNTAYSALLNTGGDTVNDDASKSPAVADMVLGMIVFLLLILAFLGVVSLLSKARLRDVGLPTNLRMFARDILIGAAACLTALAPVHTVQQVLMFLLFGKPTTSGHPLIKQVIDLPDKRLLLCTAAATVIVAPICEEITFRLLLQGWLERWEDERLGWRRQVAQAEAVDGEMQSTTEAQAVAEQSTPEAAIALPAPEPPRRGIGRLPYGWFPIIVSAAVFGIAHFGYGPEPVPIFLLGLVLGYIYQRTHRIIPSIVTHALFNLFTMFVLWRMLYGHG
jgi:membrane protease YdiL (CAAX protease family)